ncbi:MAG TPA: MFS transporter, partial [Dehalococcoidia bacterium]|nr:MFS transporter [Dehalococcoidia bacterium]
MGERLMANGREDELSQQEKYLLFAVVSLALLVSSMQFSMVSVALPELIDGLGAPLRWVGWVITIFTLAQAVSMPVAGKLSDELGRRTVFAGGLTIFAVASIACAFAPNVYVLIAARAIQGLAGGSLMPSAYGIVGDTFPGSRAQALGLISSIFPVGSVLGPNIGGVIVDHLGWRWTFGLNGPIGAIVVVAILLVMRRGGQERRKRASIDYAGAGLLALGVGGLIYSLTELGQTDTDPNYIIVAAGIVTAIVGLVLFLRQESRSADPVVDLTLLRRKEFAFVNTLNFFYGVSVFGLFSFIPLYAESAYGMSSSE